MSALERHRGQGRDEYPLRPLWNSILAGIVFQHGSIESLRRELKRNGQLRFVCGFDSGKGSRGVPPSYVYCRFLPLLFAHGDLVGAMFYELTAASAVEQPAGKALVDIRDLWKDGERERIVPGRQNVAYDHRGKVYCYCMEAGGRQEMAYGGGEKDRNCLKYRCPARHYGMKCSSIGSCDVGHSLRIKAVRASHKRPHRKRDVIPGALVATPFSPGDREEQPSRCGTMETGGYLDHCKFRRSGRTCLEEHMKLLSFDIEISDDFELGPHEEMEEYAPFHISVAATAIHDGDERIWYSDGEDGHPALSMTQQRAHELLEYLGEMQQAGYMVSAWNGLSFDLKWIGHQAGDMALAARIALKSYDPMFQFFNLAGFPVGLAKVAQAMGITQEKLMASADAPTEWRAGNFQRVMDYCLGDCQMTNLVILAIQKARETRWVTGKGTISSKPMPRLKTVEEVIQDPEPSQSWMDRPMPKRKFYGWVKEATEMQE